MCIDGCLNEYGGDIGFVWSAITSSRQLLKVCDISKGVMKDTEVSVPCRQVGHEVPKHIGLWLRLHDNRLVKN